MSGQIPEVELQVASKGSAVLSKSRRYRYLLTRNLTGKGPAVVFVMLNPSTADAMVDDATIRRCIGFARQWKASMLSVVNLFALRSPYPKALKRASKPVGKMNQHYVRTTVARKNVIVVCAWGAHGSHLDQDKKVMKWLTSLGVKPKCLGTTKDGMPRHPLRLPYSTKLQPFKIRDPWVDFPVPVYTDRGVEWL